MGLHDLVKRNRCYRRYKRSSDIDIDMLKSFVDLARLCASSQNLQPLSYYLSCDAQTNSRIFSCLSWAGYMENWSGPKENERPSAYIVILGDKRVCDDFSIDTGIAAQTIRLGAAEMGLGSCMIASVDRERLGYYLDIPQYMETVLVIPLGVPGESILIDTLNRGGDVRYWRDEADVHHVPKRTLEDIIINV